MGDALEGKIVIGEDCHSTLEWRDGRALGDRLCSLCFEPLWVAFGHLNHSALCLRLPRHGSSTPGFRCPPFSPRLVRTGSCGCQARRFFRLRRMTQNFAPSPTYPTSSAQIRPVCGYQHARTFPTASRAARFYRCSRDSRPRCLARISDPARRVAGGCSEGSARLYL